MQDYNEDKAGNKRTLVVKYGENYASKIPFIVSLLNVILLTVLVNVDYLFIIVVPVLILNVIESYVFMQKWGYERFFLKKLRTFFIYRNFIITSVVFIVYFSIKNFSEKYENVLSLILITVFITLPAIIFLFLNLKHDAKNHASFA